MTLEGGETDVERDRASCRKGRGDRVVDHLLMLPLAKSAASGVLRRAARFVDWRPSSSFV